MTENPQDIALKKELEKVNWPIKFGIVHVKIRDGKPVLATIEETYKLD